jgi:hypothetical protein
MIKNEFNEYIISVDIKGIDNDIQHQTLVKIHEHTDIVIDQILVYDNDTKSYILKDNISLEFIPMNI